MTEPIHKRVKDTNLLAKTKQGLKEIIVGVDEGGIYLAAAGKMLMSRSNLNIRVKALFGVSPLDFVKTVRFNEACRLLREARLSVAEISYKVGFTTPSYFTAAFRRFMGCTPSDWLKQNGKKL